MVSLLTTKEIAERFGVETRTVQRWVERGWLRAVQKLPGPNGTLLYLPADVEKFARKRELEVAG